MYYENYENVVAQKNNEQKYILKELPTQPICIISLSSVTNSKDSQKVHEFVTYFKLATLISRNLSTPSTKTFYELAHHSTT